MVSRSLVVLSACAAVATASLNITDTIPVAVPISQPPFSKSLSPNLVGFSLEFQFWPVYAGNATGQPNYYVNQLLSNLGERTGKTPALRVGGEYFGCFEPVKQALLGITILAVERLTYLS